MMVWEKKNAKAVGIGIGYFGNDQAEAPIGLEKVHPGLKLAIFGICVGFLGCNLFGDGENVTCRIMP